MYSKLFAHAAAHILVLPIVALLLFIAVFALVVTRTMRRRPSEYAGAAALPLEVEVVSPARKGGRHG